MSDVTYRWTPGEQATQAEWDRVDDILAARGWVSLNRKTTVLLIAERGGELVGFHALQWIPYLGPIFVRPSDRGTGVAERLIDDMLEFMEKAQARGFLVISQSDVITKECEAIGMQRVESPVFIMGGKG